jgi:hypothetical protein
VQGGENSEFIDAVRHLRWILRFSGLGCKIEEWRSITHSVESAQPLNNNTFVIRELNTKVDFVLLIGEEFGALMILTLFLKVMHLSVA